MTDDKKTLHGTVHGRRTVYYRKRIIAHEFEHLSFTGRHCVRNIKNERNIREHHNKLVSPSPVRDGREQQTEQADRRRCRDAPLVCCRRANDRRRRTLPTGVLRLYHYTTTTTTTTTPTTTSVPQSTRSHEPLSPTQRSKLVINRRARGSKNVFR